jgi:hypothetical protein
MEGKGGGEEGGGNEREIFLYLLSSYMDKLIFKRF